MKAIGILSQCFNFCVDMRLDIRQNPFSEPIQSYPTHASLWYEELRWKNPRRRTMAGWRHGVIGWRHGMRGWRHGTRGWRHGVRGWRHAASACVVQSLPAAVAHDSQPLLLLERLPELVEDRVARLDAARGLFWWPPPVHTRGALHGEKRKKCI